jgi:hypothetical protein
MATVRYLVHDVGAALVFYTGPLGFALIEAPSGNPVELFESGH